MTPGRPVHKPYSKGLISAKKSAYTLGFHEIYCLAVELLSLPTYIYVMVTVDNWSFYRIIGHSIE